MNDLEKKLMSPSVIDYLAGKAKEHNVGIRVELEQNGVYGSLSIWDKGNEKVVEKWEKFDISKIQTKQQITSNNQKNSEEKLETENSNDTSDEGNT